MAFLSFFSFPALSLALSLWVVLVSPAHSLNCTSQKFKSNRLYANCSDLPSLNSYLHYTYNSSNSSLSIAYLAAPAKSDGWIGWGINPNGTGMVGGQVLVALKTNGALVVNTYNLVSYRDIRESKLSFDLWDLSAETDSTSGNFVIFASVKVQDKAEKLNQIWQVGPSVTNGKPDKHELSKANLQAKATLELVASSSPSGGGGNGSTTTNSTTAGNSTSACFRIKELHMVFLFWLSVFLGHLIGF